MSIQYCEICDTYIDTDFNAEHFEMHEKKQMNYLCYIKSHCEAPDYEVEVEAPNKNEAVKVILSRIGKYGWEYDEIEKNTQQL